MFVVTPERVTLSEGLKQIALDELNVKEYDEAADADEFISYKLKPQLKTLGPKYGKKLGAISAFLNSCDAEKAKKVVDAVKNGGTYALETDSSVTLAEEDLQIFTESRSGFVSACDKGYTVALDTTLTNELIREGFEREIVSKIQTLRKEADFNVTDRIEVYYSASGMALEVLRQGNFAADVLAVNVAQITETTPVGYTRETDVNGEKVTFTLVRV